MKTVVKQIFSFILPVTVLIIVPWSIEDDITSISLFALLIGILIMCLGIYLMTVTISSFIRIGKGTLAPWSPTKKLVITGLYSHVRNPMILGVLITLIGESVAITSVKIFNWSVIFFIINNIYFTLYEEPNLERRFGEEYKEYKKSVRRWIPRLKPYRPGSESR